MFCAPRAPFFFLSLFLSNVLTRNILLTQPCVNQLPNVTQRSSISVVDCLFGKKNPSLSLSLLKFPSATLPIAPRGKLVAPKKKANERWTNKGSSKQAKKNVAFSLLQGFLSPLYMHDITYGERRNYAAGACWGGPHALGQILVSGGRRRRGEGGGDAGHASRNFFLLTVCVCCTWTVYSMFVHTYRLVPLCDLAHRHVCM